MSTFTARSSHARRSAVALGAGRIALSAGLLAAPVPAVRALGVDSASAKRMSFVVRMAAVRDAGLGVGIVCNRDRADLSTWLAVGAAADAVDAIALAAALRGGVARGALAAGSVLGAAAVAVLGGWAAAAVRPGRRRLRVRD